MKTNKLLNTMICAGALMTGTTVDAAVVSPVLGLDFIQNGVHVDTIDAGDTALLSVIAGPASSIPTEFVGVELTGFQSGFTVSSALGNYDESAGTWVYTTQPGGVLATTISVTAPDDWTGGALTINGTATAFDIVDFSTSAPAFSTATLDVNAAPSTVPLPTAAWLFGSALFGLTTVKCKSHNA